MVKIGIIGLGEISRHQIEALKLLRDKYKIVALCDLKRRNAESYSDSISQIFGSYPKIYDTSEQFISDNEIETVLISTPPSSHFQLTCDCLENHKNVILEKPAVLKLEELDFMYKKADENGRYLYIAYHAAFGMEMIWWEKNHKKLNLGKIRKIKCRFYDTYMVQNEIMESRKVLGGSFLDSGVNALSICSELISLNDFELEGVRKKETKENIEYSDTHIFNDSKCKIVINTSWERNLNSKSSCLEFTDNDITVKIEHTKQSVILMTNNNAEVIYEYSELPRLTVQYLNVFKDFLERRENREQTYQIHRLLLA